MADTPRTPPPTPASWWRRRRTHVALAALAAVAVLITARSTTHTTPAPGTAPAGPIVIQGHPAATTPTDPRAMWPIPIPTRDPAQERAQDYDPPGGPRDTPRDLLQDLPWRAYGVLMELTGVAPDGRLIITVAYTVTEATARDTYRRVLSLHRDNPGKYQARFVPWAQYRAELCADRGDSCPVAPAPEPPNPEAHDGHPSHDEAHHDPDDRDVEIQ